MEGEEYEMERKTKWEEIKRDWIERNKNKTEKIRWRKQEKKNGKNKIAK